MNATAPLQGGFNANRGYQLNTVAWVFSVLDIAIVAARMYATKKKRASFGPDGLMCIPALICCLAVNVTCITFVQVGGVGKHAVSLDPSVLIIWAKILYAHIMLYSLGIVLPKLAILLFYLRIFPTRNFRWAVYSLGVFVIAWGLGVIFVTIFQCYPVAKAWNMHLRGTCVDLLPFYRWLSLPNILYDIIMLALPVHMVWKLQITTRQKWGVSSAFLLGGIGLISSVVRMSNFFTQDAFADPTWTSGELLIWSVVETSAILIAACLPTLKPLFVKSWPKTRTTKLNSAPRSEKRRQDSHLSWSGTRPTSGVQKGFSRIATPTRKENDWTDTEADGMPLRPIPRYDLEQYAASL